MRKILIIDDTVMLVGAIDLMMTELGYQVDGVSDSLMGERQALQEDYDLIAVDLKMPYKNGAEIVESIIKNKPEARVVVMTGYPDDPMVDRSLKAGALAMIPKPFKVSCLVDYLPS